MPVVASATVTALAAWSLIWLYGRSRVGPLTMLLFIAYALPFIHVLPYIWFDFDAESPLILWGLVVNPYMTDKTIIELMSMMGSVGAAGFVAGASLLQGKLSADLSSERIVLYRTVGKTLSLPVFFSWVAIAIVLTWISAPSDTVFTTAYTESKAIIEEWNFSSAWMFSYAFLLFVFADSMFETLPRVRKIKRKIVFLSFLLIVIWFQLLRGDRESLPCVLAAGLMYYMWGKGLLSSAKDRLKLNWQMIFFFLFFVFIAAYIVGAVRHSLVNVVSISDLLNTLNIIEETGAIRFDNLISGTWSAVLLTPLSVAGDYIHGSLPLKYGQTYLDLLASIVPGFLADWVDYSRPIDALHNPALEMTYGLGGTHAVVVPFINFGMAGIFLIVALWSFAIAKIEHYLIKNPTVQNFALFGIIAMAIPHWLWYGEKYIINSLIIWLILATFYRVRLSSTVTTPLGGIYQS